MTNNDRKPTDYELGKTEKNVEYGVLYSNGKVDWARDLMVDISSAYKRAEFLKDYQTRVANLNIAVERDIMFVKRSVTTKYGQLIPVIED